MKIVITVGLPGSGKSTYLARHGINAISSDEIRRLIADDPTDQAIHKRVFAVIRYLIRQRIAIGRPVTYVDATHLTRWERRPYVELARRCGCKIAALFFDVPMEICIQRNKKRDRVVPERAIRQMAERFEVQPDCENRAQLSPYSVNIRPLLSTLNNSVNSWPQ
ncbi:MAG TPA: ATP-binding protein [Bryobacteraceae bacterium]|nr:ATP-binding protein [Bryobacteraceae bacterium]